jgi:DNA-binding transcriptional LysR family regulator
MRAPSGALDSRMDKQEAMKCFCRVVDTGSFAAAARDLSCSPSLVTKQVKLLERWTAARLIARSTRSLQLTDAGQRFYKYCRSVLDETESMLCDMQTGTSRLAGKLVIAAPISLTLGHLGRTIQDFAALHPEVQLEVRLSDHTSDLIKEGVDVALRGKGRLEDSSLVAVSLWHFGRVLVASEGYLARHGEPGTPQDLQHHNCLGYLLGSDAACWTFESPDGQRVNVEIAGSICSDSSAFLVDAVTRDLGIALVPEVLVSGKTQLRRLLPSWTTDARTLFAVYVHRAFMPAKTTAFIQFLRQRLA